MKDDGPDMAVDSEGHSLAYTPAEVRAITARMIRDGDLLAVISRVNGDVAILVLGPPSEEIIAALETTLRAYRRVLKGH